MRASRKWDYSQTDGSLMKKVPQIGRFQRGSRMSVPQRGRCL